MSKRKQYSPEFKREAVELARRSGTSCRQIAQEIGVAPSLLNRWVREARAAEKPFPAQATREMKNLPGSSASWPE